LNVHFTTSGGNHDNCDTTSGIEILNEIRAPGDAWNGITVGSYADQNNPDTISNHCYLDPSGRSFKPDMSAPGEDICTAAYPGCVGGPAVSFALPQVAGAMADVISADISVRYKPQEVKAILLASSLYHRVTKPQQVDAALSDKEGLGSLTIKWAGSVATSR
jgi:hypothetical protein